MAPQDGYALAGDSKPRRASRALPEMNTEPVFASKDESD